MAWQLPNGGIRVKTTIRRENRPVLFFELFEEFLREHDDLGKIGSISRGKDIDGKWVYTASLGNFTLFFLVKDLALDKSIIDVAISNARADSHVLDFVLQNLRDSLTQFLTNKSL